MQGIKYREAVFFPVANSGAKGTESMDTESMDTESTGTDSTGID